MRPTGLDSFRLTPRLANGWDRIALRHIKAFGTDFDIEAERGAKGLLVRIIDHGSGYIKSFKAAEGSPIEVKL